MKSYRSSSTFVIVNLLYHELLSFLKKALSRLFFLLYEELHIEFETKNDKIKTHLMEGVIPIVLY